MKKFLLFCAVAIAFLLQSCSMYQKIHFNKDYSGTFRLEIDMGELMAFAMMMDTTGGDMNEGDMMKEMFGAMEESGIKEQYESLEGISNVFIEPMDDSGIIIEFDFDDLEALNQSQSQLGEVFDDMAPGMSDEMTMDFNQAPGNDFKAFRLDKKTLTHVSEPPAADALEGLGELEDLEEDLGDMDELGDMGMGDMLGGMGELMSIKMDYEFDRKIKEVEVEGLIIEKQDKHYVSTTLNMENMMDAMSYRISFKLK